MTRNHHAAVRVGIGVWLSTAGCARVEEKPTTAPSAATSPVDVLEIHRELEARIDAGNVGKGERERAYERAAAVDDDGTAGYAFARAAIAGRLAEARGLGAGKLVGEAEQWARTSIQRDPDFHDLAATRLLGTLYVLAPARLVEHGDSEEGLAMLEQLVATRPDDPRNHLRVAEAYVALGDGEPALAHVCFARRRVSELPRDEQRLLGRLIDDLGGAEALACGEKAS